MQRPLSERTYIEGNIAIPKKVLKDIFTHKHYRAFVLFLQLKPLYTSSVIMNDNGKLPYAIMAAYLGISVSGLRARIRQLKKYKLARADKDKNIRLASYKTFVNLFQPQYFRRMKKYRYCNVADADILLRTAAIEENYKKQNYKLKNKIISKEIYSTVNAHQDRINSPKVNPFTIKADCPVNMHRTDLSKTAIRKIRKMLLKDYDNLLWKHKQIFRQQIAAIENGFPDINPYVTLSCAGVGRLFGLSASAGYYQRSRMLGSDVLRIKEKSRYEKVLPVSQWAQEEINASGSNVYSYNYPVKRGTGREDKFFLQLPDMLDVNHFFIYENAKN